VLANPDTSLLISGFGDDTGGGLFCFDGDHLEQLDDLSTTGLTAFDGHLARLLRTGTDEEAPGELLVYDMHGLQRYHRIDSLVDAHDIIRWADGSFVVASPASNRIVWISPSGEIVRAWRAPGRGDAWHLNGLLQQDGDLYVCAFGKFSRHREWSFGITGTGFVRNLTRERDVVTGLSAPHHPRFFDDRWCVCNSGRRELVQLDPKGLHVERRLQLQGWTRGLVVGDDLLFVGESSNRTDGAAEPQSATVALVSRADWRLIGRVEVPCSEIYDVVLAPRALVEGLRKGTRTNPLRLLEREQRVHALTSADGNGGLWTGEPLSAEDRRAALTASVGDSLPANALMDLECVVENRGSATFVSIPPCPVNISYSWLHADSGRPVGPEGARTPLPRPLPAGDRLASRIVIRTPAEEGDYELRLTLVQEGVAWFDELDGSGASVHRVRIVRPASGNVASMSETPAEPEIDVERLVEELKERVARERAAGTYVDTLSGIELELLPLEPSPQPALAQRFDLGTPGPRIRFRPELGFSTKPVIGPVITLFKKFVLRLVSFVLDDLARQADAAVTRLEAALSAEIAARESAQTDLMEVAKRHETLQSSLEQLEARLARLERTQQTP
jgi:acetolactate synthase-1/2/3 large subunit